MPFTPTFRNFFKTHELADQSEAKVSMEATPWRRITPLMACQGQPHGSGLGVVRWVAENGLACFGHHGRLKLCYEKSNAYWQAFHDLTAR